MKGFSLFSHSHFPFTDSSIPDPMNNFQGVFLTESGRRRNHAKDDFGKKKGETQSQAAAWGDAVHSLVQSEFARKGSLAMAELPVLDVGNDMLSKVDIFTKNKEAVEVKTVALSELLTMRAPRGEHKLQLIYYLNALGAAGNGIKGIILYVARESPGIRKAFEVRADGTTLELKAASAAFMREKRGGTSRAKMLRSLEIEMSEQKTTQQYADDYAENLKKVKKLERRNAALKRRREFDFSYKIAHSGSSQQSLVNTDGMPHGGLSQYLRHMITDFGSEHRRKKGDLTISKVISDSPSRKKVSFARGSRSRPSFRDKLKSTFTPPAFTPIESQTVDFDIPKSVRERKFEAMMTADARHRWRSKAEAAKLRAPSKKVAKSKKLLNKAKKRQVRDKKKAKKALSNKQKFQKSERVKSVKARRLKNEQKRQKRTSRQKEKKQVRDKNLHKKREQNVAVSLSHKETPELRDPLLEVQQAEKEQPTKSLPSKVQSANPIAAQVKKEAPAKKGLAVPKPRAFIDPPASLQKKRTPGPEPTVKTPRLRTAPEQKRPSLPPKGREVFFDIENTITRSSSGRTGYILQYGGKVLEGDLRTAAVPSGLDREALTDQITRRIDKGAPVFFKSSLLDVETAESSVRLLDSGGVGALKHAGLVDDGALSHIRQMAGRSGFETTDSGAGSFLKSELNEYLSGTTAQDSYGSRQFTPAYQKQSQFIPTTKSIGKWYESEKELLQNVSSFEQSLAEKGGETQFVGHNIRQHDNPIIKERSRIQGVKTSTSKNFSILDTLESQSEFQESFAKSVARVEKQDPAIGDIMSKTVSVGEQRKGPNALEIRGQAFEVMSETTKDAQQHMTGLHDSNVLIATKIAAEKGSDEVGERAVRRFVDMTKGQTSTKAKPLLTESQLVTPNVKNIVANKVQSLGSTRPSPTVAPLPPRSPSLMSRMTEKIENHSPAGRVFVEEVKEVSRGTKQLVTAGLDAAAPKAGLLSDAFDTMVDFAQKKVTGIDPPIRGAFNKTFKGLGVGAVAAGVGVLALGSLQNQPGPARPLASKNKIRYQDTSQGEHVLSGKEGGIQTQRNRGLLTDFGSPYQGMVGSMLGFLKAFKGSTRSLGGRGKASAQKAVSRGTKRTSSTNRPQRVRSSSATKGSPSVQTVKKNNRLGDTTEYKKSAKKAKYKRQRQFRVLSSIGTRDLFNMHKNKIGHHRM